jgi:hypothetical protein
MKIGQPEHDSTSKAPRLGIIYGREPMQNNQEYVFSDIFLKNYNIVNISI